MLFTFAQIFKWLALYRYLVLFPIAVVEGPIITVIGGFFASLNILSFWFTWVLLIIADIVGDSLYYGAGYFGRLGFLNRFGRYIGIDVHKLAGLEDHFMDHAGKTLLIGKFSQVAGAPVLVAAGASKMPFGKYLLYNLIGTIPKSLLLLTLGYFFGQAYATIYYYIKEFGVISFSAIIVFLLIWYFVKKNKKAKQEK